MQELFLDLWENNKLMVMAALGGMLLSFLGTVLAIVKASAWYKRQPWYFQRGIDIALSVIVRRLMPVAQDMRDQSGFGKLRDDDKDALNKKATADTMELLRQKMPAVIEVAAANNINLPKLIEASIPATVKKEEAKAEIKKKKANTGGRSPGGRRP